MRLEKPKKNLEEKYNDKTKWMAKIDNRGAIDDAVILIMDLRAHPDIDPTHVNIKRAAKAQEYLDSLKGKTFSIVEGEKTKYVDIDNIQKKILVHISRKYNFSLVPDLDLQS